MKVFSNYISNKLITFDGKDPPWMNGLVVKVLDSQSRGPVSLSSFQGR